MDKIRVLRIIEYVGPRDWVEKTVEKSIHGTKAMDNGAVIRAATIGGYPEILEDLEEDKLIMYAIGTRGSEGYDYGPLDNLDEIRLQIGNRRQYILHLNYDGGTEGVYDKPIFYWSSTLENWVPLD